MVKVSLVNISQLLQALPEGSTAEDRKQVNKACEFARTAHQERIRESKETYYDHDLAVAYIVARLGMDVSTITSALLHDILLPHTGKEIAEIRKDFGQAVAEVVSALEKLTPYTEKHDESKDDKTLEAIRRAILTIIEGDTRVILIFLADRLQDLRTARNLPPAKEHQLALEAQDIHAPLANRLGIWQLKWQLEDLAFSVLEPDHYKKISKAIDEKREQRDRRINRAASVLARRITESGIQADVSGRPKHIYSIYKKIQDKGLLFEHVYDIQALRVIINDEEPSLCYQILGIVHNLWQPIPQEFDDYVARPKANGYQSLHTAVVDDHGQTLEVQIRTRSMHEEAERGIAAHWAYKEGGRPSSYINQKVAWLRELMTSLRETNGDKIDIETFRYELLGERIYVFTPRGDVIDLPQGATPIDFAYAIHTEVGHRCRGTRVNGKMVGLDYKLQSGEQVDIITTNKGGPSRDWMNETLGYTASARTRSKVRSWFRQQEREKNITQGREVVARELKRLGVADIYTIPDIAEALKFQDTDKFLAKVGFGDIQSTQIGGAIAALQQKLRPDDELRPLLSRPTSEKSKQLTVRGIAGLHTKMAGCCNPIPPEPIAGYITRGRGITIHSKNCQQLIATDEPERWIEVEWGSEEETYPIPIIINSYRRAGLMDDIANILKGQDISLSRTKTITANGITTVYMVAEVTSLEQLNWILGKFDKLNNVIEARRQRWTD